MKFNNSEIYQIANVLTKTFDNLDIYIPAKANFFIQKNISTLAAAAQEIEKSRLEIAKHYGELDEENQQYKIPEDKIEEANIDNPLLQFLGKENVEDMKKRIVDVIVEQVRDDMHDYREYLIDPDDIVERLMDDTIDRVQDRVQEKLEKIVLERAMKKLGFEE